MTPDQRQYTERAADMRAEAAEMVELEEACPSPWRTPTYVQLVQRVRSLQAYLTRVFGEVPRTQMHRDLLDILRGDDDGPEALGS